MNVSARQSLNRFAPVRSVVSMHTKLSPHHKRVFSALGTITLGVVFGLGATALGAAGVVTKFDTFCATWIKPIYLAVLAAVVLFQVYQGFVQVVNEDGHGGRKIGVALIAGAAGVLVPAAILTSVAIGSAFNC